MASVEWRFTSEGLPWLEFVHAVQVLDDQEKVVVELGGCVQENFGDIYTAWAPIPKPALPSVVDASL
ncbi:hypothetical protein VN12_19845 [Pirellula sp. SH-Sr6A]|uniref:hypothetical protein n=1 Tax=Pirellula sp. SH-Sr6A TaxID=1632865 RepID=UPI00078E1D0C|nr:hypothetical protein [Pirellula sp. SH-Sr6A]AMV34388.1 hypothetical protein VN12_19845 [Pirellula sp. SH-Sr6A]